MLARPLRALLAALSVLGASCAGWNEPKLVPPDGLGAPYPGPEEVVWGVAPLANEAGTSLVDELRITDALVEQIRQVDGLTALPTNRTLGAMRAIGLGAVRTPEEARTLASALGVDAIVVGTITSWHPYHPPRMGMNLVLYGRTGAMRLAHADEIDLLTLRTAARESGISLRDADDLPVAAAADHVDASNHAVQMDIRAYAEGRHDPRSALGWQMYTQSMGRFTEYVCFRMVRQLLQQEAQRLAMSEARAD